MSENLQYAGEFVVEHASIITSENVEIDIIQKETGYRAKSKGRYLVKLLRIARSKSNRNNYSNNMK